MSNDAFLGAALAFFTALFLQMFISFLNRREAQRKERYEYLRDMMRLLAEARSEIQWGQIALLTNEDISIKFNITLSADQRLQAFERLQIALGKAHSILVSIDDSHLFQLGMGIMETNIPTHQNDLIEKALKRLAQMTGIANDIQIQSS